MTFSRSTVSPSVKLLLKERRTNSFLTHPVFYPPDVFIQPSVWNVGGLGALIIRISMAGQAGMIKPSPRMTYDFKSLNAALYYNIGNLSLSLNAAHQ